MAILIETTDDFLRALRENEEFLAAARREIYTQDLIALPNEFREYTQKTDTRLGKIDSDIGELKTDVSELKTDVSELKTDVSELKTDVSELKTDVKLKTDVRDLQGNMNDLQGSVSDLQGNMSDLQGNMSDLQGDVSGLQGSVNDLHGFNLERKMTSRLRQQLGSAFGLSKVRAVWTARNAAQATGRARTFERHTEEATDGELITDSEADRLIDTDMILTGTKVSTENVVYIAVEASGTIKSNDIQRARESAAILNRLYGAEAFPAVYGYYIDGQQVSEAQPDAEKALLEVHIFLESDRS